MSEFNLYDGYNSNVNDSKGNSNNNGYRDPEMASYYASNALGATGMFAKKEQSYSSAANGAILSARAYYMAIILCLFWGFMVNFILCKFFAPSIYDVNYIALILIYCVSCFAGVMMYKKSDNPAISFIGYNLIVLPVGLLLSVILQGYNSTVVSNAFLATAMITGVMCVMGALYPQVFEKITSALGATLLIVIIVEVFLTFVFRIDLGAIDYLVALLFAGYIAVDLGRASRNAYTLDNAVDAAAELYLDIINLFIRILSILARSRD